MGRIGLQRKNDFVLFHPRPGLSAIELPSRQWRLLQAGGPYEYVYRTGSEALAFLVGWSLVLHHAAFSALGSRAVGETFDALLDGRLSNFTAARLAGGGGGGQVRVDLVALVSALVAMLLVAATGCRLRLASTASSSSTTGGGRRFWIVAGVNFVVVSGVLFSFVVGLYHLHFDNWSTPERFFPSGFKGVIVLTV